MIISNTIKCLKCGDIIYSAHVHDYKTCKCGAVSVDGGMKYLKRSGDVSLIQEMSIIMDDNLVKEMVKQVVWAKETRRNEFGVVCAVARAIRDSGYKVVKDE